MKRYKVMANYVTFVSMEIEAENLDEAMEIAFNADGGDFKNDGFGDWNIDEVIEVK